MLEIVCDYQISSVHDKSLLYEYTICFKKYSYPVESQGNLALSDVCHYLHVAAPVSMAVNCTDPLCLLLEKGSTCTSPLAKV